MKMQRLLIGTILSLFSWCAAGAALAPGLPLEPNRGQAPGDVAFLSRARGLQVELSGAEITVRPHGGGEPFTVHFDGAREQAHWSGEDRLPGVSNYLQGANPSNWVLRVPHYKKARLAGLYAGIDLVVYGTEGLPEFDFVVSPGADPSQIHLRYQGGMPGLEDDGSLVLTTGRGVIRQHAPRIYQHIAGVRRDVKGRYEIPADGLVRFRLGDYNRNLPLVIDPVLSYGTFLGGSGLDNGAAIALDREGNAYIAGSTESTDLPVTGGAHAGGSAPSDVFIAKLSPSGGALLSATYIGGQRDDYATAIAVDRNGSAYVAGVTFSSDFPTTPGAVSRTLGGPDWSRRGDGFVVKLNPDGASLAYGTYLSGFEGDYVSSIAIDYPGNAHVVGTTYSDDWITTTGASQESNCPGWGNDAFYSRLNPLGTALTYSTYLCGGDHDSAHAIVVDVEGNAFVAGQTESTDFPATSRMFGPNGGGRDEAFVTRFERDGARSWSFLLGGTGSDIARAVTLDGAGNVYLAGSTLSWDMPVTPGVFQSEHADFGQSGDAFLAGINASGLALTLLSYAGGSGQDDAFGLAVDSTGRLLLAGYTASPDFSTVASPCLTGYRGNGDAFVLRLSAGATATDYGLFLGGSEKDLARAMALDASGNVYTAGQTWSANFSTTGGAYRPAYQNGFRGVADAFVTMVGPEAAPAAPCLAVNGALNNGSMLPGAVAPGEIVTIFGDGLGPPAPQLAAVAGGLFPTTVAGTRALFDGVASPIIFSYQYQIAVIVPYSVARKDTTSLVIEYAGRQTAPVTLGVTGAAPAILTQNSSGRGPGAILNGDYSVNTPDNPAPAGSVIMIYATGEGQTTPPGIDGLLAVDSLPKPLAPVRVFFGEIEGKLIYSGAAPGLVAGVLQVNAEVPAGISGKAVPLILVVGDKRSPLGVTVAVE